MNNAVFLISFLMSLLSGQSYAQDHAHHVKHNMVLFGQSDAFYVSHIVYKVPHNFQVILKVNFDSATKEILRNEMITYPAEQFIYLLDHMDISQIGEKPNISGQIFRRADDGSKKILFDQIEIASVDYSLIYFDELPLSLENLNLKVKYKLPPKENCQKIKCQ
ncbi:MAG: hypothetical protein H7336_13525 [Bacteriovorax sp.]|nr:hypothetical protein [Bacteriovorax sp.]